MNNNSFTPEACGVLVLEHKFLRSRVTCSGSRSDRIEATRQKRSFDVAAIVTSTPWSWSMLRLAVVVGWRVTDDRS